MGRVLLLADAWQMRQDSPFGLERAAILDFALQNPRVLMRSSFGAEDLLRIYGLFDSDLSDLFVPRRYHTLRERFLVTFHDLLARGLVDEVDARQGGDDTIGLRITPLGVSTATSLHSPFSMALKALSAVLVAHWADIPLSELSKRLRRSIPDQSAEVWRVTVPFGEWLGGDE